MVSKAGWLLVAAISCLAQSATVEEHSRKAQELLKANRPDLAAKEYAAVVALQPENIDAQANLGVLLFFQGDYANAAPHLHSAVQARPAIAKLRALLGMAEKRIGQPAAAQADLEKAFPEIQEGQLRKQTGLELMEVYYGAGDLDKSAAVVSALRRALPSDVEILYTAHRIYSELADEAMVRVAMLAPESARMLQLIGQQLARHGDREGAIRQLEEALKIDPRTPGLHFELAEMYNNGANPPEVRENAAKEYEAALSVNPFDEKAQCRLGDIAYRHADSKGAMAHYTRALELQPDDVEANLGLAKILLSLNDTKKAQVHLERAARLDPLDPITHYRLGGIYRDQGRTADADRQFAEFRRLRTEKEHLKGVYSAMHVQPAKQDQADADVPK